MSLTQYVLLLVNFMALSIKAQQEYSGNSVMNCNNDITNPSSAFLYSYNGYSSSCKAFLVFRAHEPYNSVPTIAALLSVDQKDVAEINNVTRLRVFPAGQEVIIPVNCFRSNLYYQANATYQIPTAHETYFLIANDTYQGLTTCMSLKHANEISEFRLQQRLELQVPLRCACPTTRQVKNGTTYLLTYPITWKENVSYISWRFNVSSKSLAEANSFSDKSHMLFPFTTILVPLQTEPTSLRTTVLHDKPNILSFPLPRENKNKSKVVLLVGGGVAATVFLLVLAILLIYKKKTGRCPWRRREGESKGAKTFDLLEEIASIDGGIKVYKYGELKKATRSFSSRSRIQGSVYRGSFKAGTRAIKRMSTNASKEINILNKINHFNLIKLHGFCEHQSSFYLVFEYMENGSLKDWLRRKQAEDNNWLKRIQIALDVANGLFYLHHFTKPAYVHKGINSSNILLDGNLRAKIGNFSLAKTAVQETNHSTSTSHVVGTKGYLAPEYIENGSLTTKIDVYAYGMVLLVLSMGKDAVIVHEGKEILLSEAIAEGENAEMMLSYTLQPALIENGGMLYALQMIKLSLRCLARDPADRPNMGEVVSTLLKIQQNAQRGFK
ncbi:transmembrane signal receptor [Lithospermum erythrorhizon]|uniref:Transmembrane signal receptor n=1 Tax=Lithospermum erythrorhizon TaxID=34254 RepID=A0AAV3RJL3_LITER